MNFELFIAKRYLVSKHKLNFITIISGISAIGITLGVAALIVVLSVFNGFGSLVTSILVNFDPHIRITAVSEDAFLKMDSISALINEIPEIDSYYPFVQGKSIIFKEDMTSIVDLKGITLENTNRTVGLKTNIKYGEFNTGNSNGLNGIIVGLNLATKIQSLVGDTITLTSFNNVSKSAATLMMPGVKRFVVKGIFESNNNDYDMYSVFTSLKPAQDLMGLRGRVQGYEIYLNDIDNSQKIKSLLEKKLDSGLFSVNTWYDLHNDLYTVMQIERWAAYVILSLIIAVAMFNVLGSLAMSVIEKKKDIGILKSMGAKDKSILRIFMFEGLLLGIIGTIAGSLLGYFIIFLQVQFKIYPLDPTRYIIDALPVEVRISDFFAVAGMSLLLSFIASLIPAKRAIKIPAVEAIKWE